MKELTWLIWAIKEFTRPMHPVELTLLSLIAVGCLAMGILMAVMSIRALYLLASRLLGHETPRPRPAYENDLC